MKKPFDKKSTSGLAKKPEKPQSPAPGTGIAPGAKPERAPQPKPKGKGKKASAHNMPVVASRPLSIAEGEAGSMYVPTGTESQHCCERN